MNRKTVFFSIAVLLILAFSNLSGLLFRSSANVLDPRQIHGGELAAVPPVEDAIGFFQGRIQENPQDAVSYRLLAEQYARQAREIGDASGYLRAEAALKESIRLIPGYALAQADLAAVHYAQHDFIAALELAQQVYEQNPNVTEALVTIGDTQLALGRYAEAEAVYRDLSEMGAVPPVLARLAALEELKGNPTEALALMQRAANEAFQAGGTQENVAWYVLRVGDLYFNSGEYRQAGRYYEAALRLFADYHLALAGLGRVHAAQGNYEKAIDYYQQAVERIPQPETLAALGDLYALTGQAEQAQLQYETVTYIGRLAAINEQIYNRQLANFYSDHNLHVEQALELALVELEIRADVYGYDAAAWAYYKNGDYHAARDMMKQAMTLGTRDARLYYHAGMIEYALGNEKESRTLLEEAWSINSYFSLLEAQEMKNILEQ